MKLFICLFCSIYVCNGMEFFHKNPMTVSNPAYAVDVKLFGTPVIKSEMKVFIDHLPHLFYHNRTNYDERTGCVNSIEMLVSDLLKGKHYPLFVLDSWGIPENGLLYGNTKWLGLYHGCLDATTPTFKPKYCFMSFGNLEYNNAFIPDGNMPLIVGACVPDACPIENLTGTFDTFNANITVVCPKQNKEWLAVDTFALITCILLVILGLIATIIDIALQKNIPNYFPLDDKNVSSVMSATADDVSWMVSVNKLSWLWKFASAFSIMSNFKRIFNTEQKSGDLSCLNGLRFISITWVILGHSYLLLVNFTDNIVSMFGYVANNWEFQAIVNATFSVDTFFFLSGLLASYLGCRQMNKTNGKLNFFKFYLHRYLRLTPLYGFVLLMFVSLYLKLVHGPLFPEVIQSSVETCKKYWFSNLLYINNLYPASVGDQCYAITWYLSNDFQFYLLVPFFLILLHRKPKVGLLMMFLVILTSITITGAFSSYSKQLPQAEMFGIIAKWAYSFAFGEPIHVFPAPPNPNQNFYITDIYTKPWCRIGVYVIGMMTGYYLHVNKNQIRMNKAVVVLGWLVSAAVSCSIVYGLYPSLANDYQLSNDVAAFYNAVTRPLWSLCMAWVTIACTSGYGGPVNTMLSWTGFIPLSRLTYALYLVHPLVIWWFLGSSDRLFHFNIPTYILVYIGSLVLSTGVALLCALFVEYPFVALTKSTVKARNTETVDENPAVPITGEMEAEET